jgi:Ser/Thr protein kinase RdoA (MazF antagonist)
MLMRDFGGEALSAASPPSSLAEALRTYARMQLSWIDRADELTAIGGPDRTLDTVAARIEPLLAATELLLPDHPEGLSPSELEAVPALRERLQAACEALRACELPPTLEHGDLHTNNVRERDGGFVIFDWSDGCLSVPFFSLVPFFEFHSSSLAAGLREQLRDAYLEAWMGVGPRERLVEAFELAQFVGLFHQAISYHQITEHTEPRARWEWERGFPYFVKRLLERADAP